MGLYGNIFLNSNDFINITISAETIQKISEQCLYNDSVITESVDDIVVNIIEKIKYVLSKTGDDDKADRIANDIKDISKDITEDIKKMVLIIIL